MLHMILLACLWHTAAWAADGGSGKILVAMASPSRIAAGDDILFVSDYRENVIFLIEKTTLKVLRSFPVSGSPLAVAWSSGRVYVGNESTGSIDVFNHSGKQIGVLVAPGGVPLRASDMTVDEGAGILLVVDSADHSVKLFGLGGSLIRTITSAALVNPTGIALDAQHGEIMVSDYGDPALSYPAKVHVFDTAGTLVRSIPGGPAGFSRPQGMAFDSGHLFLADALVGKVLVLDRLTGAVLKTVGSFGDGPGGLMLPLDVSIDPVTRDLYVTNNRPGRIERFAEGGLVP
jgi:DNA-binding beta-propeller fold protein YncE